LDNFTFTVTALVGSWHLGLKSERRSFPIVDNAQNLAKDCSELRITFERGVYSAMPPDTSIL
jgi:hypothetical protein